ncbi:MAG: glutathione S-transferase [Gammaproteobacteria bacterium SG8_31]|jgi:glutathione S-transferase|nr:MAG: glutathione S-transferase [Gammaproteobacteria bacterium SG8_31]
MIIVHHLENSRSQRVLWLLEELGLEYRIKLYKRDPATMLGPDSLKKVHPLGKSPVVQDQGKVIAESGAIMEYLIGRYGEGRLIPPPDTDDRLAYTYWLHYAEGSLMPMMLLKLVFDRFAHPPMPLVMRPVAAVIAIGVKAKFVTPRLAQHLDFIEAELGKSTWFAGEELTGADIQMSFPLEAAAARGAVDDRPNIRAFVERIHARPAYQEALRRGGPYDYA